MTYSWRATSEIHPNGASFTLIKDGVDVATFKNHDEFLMYRNHIQKEAIEEYKAEERRNVPALGTTA